MRSRKPLVSPPQSQIAPALAGLMSLTPSPRAFDGGSVASSSAKAVGAADDMRRQASAGRSADAWNRLASDESLDETECGVGDLAPAAVDGQCVSAAGDFLDLGDSLVALLLLERSVGDGPRHRVVVLAGDDQQRPALGVLAVDLRFGPWVEVGGRRLEQRSTRSRHRVLVVELLGLVLADRVGERVTELLVRQRYRAVVVGRIGQPRTTT